MLLRSILFIAVLLPVLILPSCASPKKTVQEGSTLVCKLERTPCFGMCPIYSISLFGDRSVVYEGKRFVDSIGTFRWQAEKDLFLSVQKHLNEVRKQRLEKTYPEEKMIPTDLPSTRLTFRQDDTLFTTTLKTREAPDALLKLAELMDSLGKP